MTFVQVTLNSVDLFVDTIIPTMEPRTVKQVVGKRLVETPILGSNEFQYRLSISGTITATTANTLEQNRDAIIALNNLNAYAYVDGRHDGNYIIVPNSLQFEDSAEDYFSVARYKMELVEE